MSPEDFEPKPERERDSFVDTTKEIVNVSGKIMKFELHGIRYVMHPEEFRRVHFNYASDRQIDPKRDRVASVVELLTAGNVMPIDAPKCPPQYRKGEQAYLRMKAEQEAANRVTTKTK